MRGAGCRTDGRVAILVAAECDGERKGACWRVGVDVHWGWDVAGKLFTSVRIGRPFADVLTLAAGHVVWCAYCS